ncbi:aldehyde dehydrogenase family protein [Gemmobacter fulvus]|uniref:Aldehyde dehydrogenase family protein n=1 Tax=Gemmobacter fulvus TaxID=2840474 RepID=A0A975S1M8_9RHOB|nr:aldehyde dehydrogenase family protein [Gemmobacter fulvus]MBT9245448.1 aldehyde dehydrogenase family protein [Gemmobacter fulvus]QWK90245.1 aldehyde dehydrogenase family protein [Gemmobacter fulvus]
MTHDVFSVISPVDGSLYLSRPYASAPEIAAKLAAARAAVKPWRQVPLAERVALVQRFGAEMSARAEALAEAVTWGIGRPRWQADETPRLALVGDLLAQTAAVTLADTPFESDDTVRRFARPVPGGLHLSICAWNYPTAMLGYLVSQPLIAGNVVILKHSPQTPVIAELAEEAWRAAGGPAGAFQMLHLSHADAERAIAAGQFDAVNFIGSVAGGKRLHAAAGGTMTTVHLELGGKDPAYIRADADIDRLVADIAEGCFSNAGQSCCSVERIYVDRRVQARFTEALLAEAQKWTIGHPVQDKAMIGPVVHAAAAQRIRDQIAQAVAAGGRALIGASCDLGAAYVPAEVLVDLDHGMSIMRDELFGPVAAIQAVSGDDEAITLMNDSQYGLSASIWTEDEARGLALLDQVEAGTVYLNRCDHADLYLPWGGVKDSGLGRTNGRVGLLEATAAKAFHVRRTLG